MPAWPNILGISAYYHDAAAALLCDGRIVAAAQEERFTRRKNDPDFPRHAISACLRQANLTRQQLDAVVFYDKPILKFTRVLEMYLAVAPRGWRTFPTVMSNWLGEKLDLRGAIRRELPELRADCAVLFTEHHQAHAASAFYPSPFSRGGHPHRGWRRRMGDDHDWHRLRLGNQNSRGAAFSAFPRAAVFGVHGLLRIPHQFRRIQIDGPGALRRTKICRCHPHKFGGPESRTARSG